MVMWLIGLSGAGKTAIGQEVHRLLKARRPNVAFLDGDQVREMMGNDLGHSLADRRKNAERISRLCQWLDRQGIDVVCAILSMFPESQAWNRANFSRYFEVYIRVSPEVLQARDPKGLYLRARRGEAKDVAGVDLPFTPPPHPDLILDNDASLASLTGMAERIIEAMPWEVPC
jgi:adenylylsulfate kinase